MFGNTSGACGAADAGADEPPATGDVAGDFAGVAAPFAGVPGVVEALSLADAEVFFRMRGGMVVLAFLG
jgi:hypothetical protein